MRWDNLFDDLESQLDAELGSEAADASHDAERARRADLTLSAEIAQETASGDAAGPLSMWIDGVHLWITVDNWGSDWLSGEITAPSRWTGYSIVRLDCVERFELPGRDLPKTSRGDLPRNDSSDSSSPPISAGRKRRLGNITFRIVLRDLSRRRKRGYLRSDGREVLGTINRVGKDYVEVGMASGAQGLVLNSAKNRQLVPLARVALFRLED